MVEGELADLVDEQGPAVCGLEDPGLISIGPGEGALAKPEERALGQGRREGAAVEHDQGPAPTRGPVDRLRRALFARAGLPEQQDVQGRRRELVDLRVELAHGQAAPVQLAVAVGGEDLELDLGDLEEREATRPGPKHVADLELDLGMLGARPTAEKILARLRERHR